jgi:hypothetical protein
MSRLGSASILTYARLRPPPAAAVPPYARACRSGSGPHLPTSRRHSRTRQRRAIVRAGRWRRGGRRERGDGARRRGRRNWLGPPSFRPREDHEPLHLGTGDGWDGDGVRGSAPPAAFTSGGAAEAGGRHDRCSRLARTPKGDSTRTTSLPIRQSTVAPPNPTQCRPAGKYPIIANGRAVRRRCVSPARWLPPAGAPGVSGLPPCRRPNRAQTTQATNGGAGDQRGHEHPMPAPKRPQPTRHTPAGLGGHRILPHHVLVTGRAQ